MAIAIIIAVVLVIVDQVTKFLIVLNIDEGAIVTAIPGLLDLTYYKNDGMALGLGSESFRWVFVVITVIVCGVLIYLMTRKEFKSKLFFASVSCIVAGGIGNMIDRILNGYVVDFLAVSFFPPVCNFADYCVTAGTVMLVIYLVFYYGKNGKDKKSSPESENVNITDEV
ncbi:MAG: signal peptidase II [Ruminococcus sp.]